MYENCGQTELVTEIIGHGQLEEFHQRHGNGTMYQYHKEKRLELEALYRSMTPEQRKAWPLTHSEKFGTQPSFYQI